MSESMRKIIYYENILEFKENTKDDLSLSEVNDWKICRTCLVDTHAEDVDLEKMCVMDILEGKFYNIKEMITVATNIKIPTEEKMPSKVCKACFNKITNLYYFTLQVCKADKILKRLANKLKLNYDIITNIEEVEHEKPEESVIIEVEELFSYTPGMEIAQEIEASIIEHNEETTQQKDWTEESSECKDDFECLEELFQEDYEILKCEKSIGNERKECDIAEREELIFENGSVYDVKVNEENEDNQSQADSFEEVILTEVEYLEEGLNKRKGEFVSFECIQENVKKPNLGLLSKSRFKHKQPRITQPLLEELKCCICEQKFDLQQELIRHVQDEHPNSKAYKCRHCSAAFSHIQSLSRHMNTHKKHLVKNTCEYCYKPFLRADDLKRHIRTHTGERPYSCSYCEKSFKQHGEMRAHEDTHFPTKTYNCIHCKKTFASRNGLYLHKKTHHNSPKLNPNKRVTKKQKEKEKVKKFSSEEE